MKSNSDIIEAMVDSIGVAAVLDVLASVCEYKQEHVQTHWQDTVLAKKFRDAAKRIRTAESNVLRLELP